MDDTWIPKQVFDGQLHHGFRRPGGQHKWYKDCLKTTLNQCNITPSELETLARDRTDWWSTCKSAVEELELRHIQELESKRDLSKFGPTSISNFECQICHRSWIALLVHNKSHLWWRDLSHRQLISPWQRSRWCRWNALDDETDPIDCHGWCMRETDQCMPCASGRQFVRSAVEMWRIKARH